MSIDKIGLASGCGAEEYRDWKNTLFQSYDPLGSMEIEMKFRWKDLMSRKETGEELWGSMLPQLAGPFEIN